MNAANQTPAEFDSIQTTIDALTSTIAHAEQQLAEKKRVLRELERHIEAARADCELEVYSTTDTNGKALYANAEARKAATTRAMATNGELRQLQRKYDEAQNSIDVLTVQRDDASRSRQNALGLLAYVTSWNYQTQPLVRISVDGVAR